jgi:hypothetical protein
MATIQQLEGREQELQAQLNHYQRISPDISEINLEDYAEMVTKSLQVADRNEQRTLLRGLIDHITAERQGEKVVGMIHFILPSVCAYNPEPPRRREL